MSDSLIQSIKDNQDELLERQSEFIASQMEELSTLRNRVYGYSHEDFAVENLESVYDAITEADRTLEEPAGLSAASAVGFTALLKTGDSIYTQGNILYINGTLCEGMTSDDEAGYTFTGEDGEEFVNVWYFGNGSLSLNKAINFNVFDIIITKLSDEISIDTSYYDYADYVHVKGGFVLSSVKSVKTLHNSQDNANRTKIGYSLKTLIEDSENINFVSNILSSNAKSTIQKIVLSNVTNANTLVYNNPTAFQGCTNAEIVMPNLVSIGSAPVGNCNLSGCAVNGVKKFTLPETVTNVTYGSIGNVGTLIVKTTNAAYAEGWVNTGATPPSVFIIDVADGTFESSINLSIAAKNWDKDDFVDFFTDKLKDISEDVKTLKIPSTIYDALTDEEFEIAEDKGWTIGA